MADLFGTSLRRVGVSISVLLLAAGCTVIDGSKPTSGQNQPTEKTELQAAEAAAETPIAPLAAAPSAGQIPLPLPAPRNHGSVQVASIDPSAGVSALSGTSPSARDLAGVYVDYGTALASLDSNRLRTPSDVRRALAALRFTKPNELADGWYAAHAVIASQDPVFSQGVRAEIRVLGKKAFLAVLEADEKYILQVPGVSSASAAVVSSIKSRNEQLAAQSARFISTAHQFQKQKWGMADPLPPATAPTKTAAASNVIENARALLGELSPISAAHAYSPGIMNHILKLAAHQVADGSIHAAQATPAHTVTGRCLNWARLNLNQCIAAARFPSEEAWCTGKHALEEVRSCWAEALPPSAR